MEPDYVREMVLNILAQDKQWWVDINYLFPKGNMWPILIGRAIIIAKMEGLN